MRCVVRQRLGIGFMSFIWTRFGQRTQQRTQRPHVAAVILHSGSKRVRRPVHLARWSASGQVRSPAVQPEHRTCTPMLLGRGAAPNENRLASTPTFRPLRMNSLRKARAVN